MYIQVRKKLIKKDCFFTFCKIMCKKKNISVCFTTDQFDKFSDGKSTVVVVDLLRATLVISTAFIKGMKEIIPVQSLEEWIIL